MTRVTINRTTARLTKRDTYTSGSVGLNVTAEFSADWNGLTKIAVFIAGDVKVDVPMEGNAVKIPHEVLASPGKTLVLGFYGTDYDGSVVIPTVYCPLGTVMQGAEPCGVAPASPTPNFVSQMMQSADAANAAASNANDAASSAATAASNANTAATTANAAAAELLAKAEAGEFDGKPGEKGDPGKDAEVTNGAVVEALGYQPGMVNPNLLGNWYFGNPVNQRGQLSYSGTSYAIDRWKGNAGNSSLTVENGFLSISKLGDYLQRLESYQMDAIYGSTVTASVLLNDGTIETYTVTPTRPTAWAWFVQGNFMRLGGTQSIIAFYLRPGEYKAAKLEFGTHQTLAHQENGVWVLNEIPDYGEQLARCQRYFQIFTDASSRPQNGIDYRPVMRANPALSTIQIYGSTYYASSADL